MFPVIVLCFTINVKYLIIVTLSWQTVLFLPRLNPIIAFPVVILTPNQRSVLVYGKFSQNIFQTKYWVRSNQTSRSAQTRSCSGLLRLDVSPAVTIDIQAVSSECLCLRQPVSVPPARVVVEAPWETCEAWDMAGLGWRLFCSRLVLPPGGAGVATQRLGPVLASRHLVNTLLTLLAMPGMAGLSLSSLLSVSPVGSVISSHIISCNNLQYREF